MQIYLLRHGIAEDGSLTLRDPDRALTPDGRKRLKEVLRVAHAAEVAPTLIVSSPYKRAWQTAEIAAEVLEYRGELVRADALVPDSNPAEVWEEIRAHRDQQQLLLASHEPLLSASISYLLNAPSMMVDVKKGSLTRIDIESFPPRPHGVLKWMLTAGLAIKAS